MATVSTQLAPGLPSGLVGSTQTQSKPEKHDVACDIMYFALQGTPAPFHMGRPGTVLGPMKSLPVIVHDISGEEGKYPIDTYGFQFVKHESKEKDFLDAEKIKAEYYPEIEQLVKDVTGASRTYVFNHVIRRQPKEAADGSVPGRGPTYNAHVDQTYDDAPNRVRRYFPDEAEELLKKRYQIINVWRPIKTILKDPFAVVDARTVPDEDIIPVTMVYPNNIVDEKGACRPNPDHVWYYKYAQRPDEPLLFKNFDSTTDGKARRNPHSAFVDPAHENDYMRESIEVRVLTFFDE
ncbi:hypothetical protein EV127DRAFT_458683 [Xylaria flabelliformis]|nr:hypothetical protein EV127DRAFT_458683 [Xylaria flabelliformis]KAI0859264.1 hypothetical protein F4860DRAFT_483667 [Xylaria cubensis]